MYLISEKITITTFSPLLIGTKSPEYGWGLWKLEDNNPYVYVVDLDKFMAFLDEVNLIDKFADQYSDKESFAGNDSWVERFLNENGVLNGVRIKEKREIAQRISSSVVYLPGDGRYTPFVRSGKSDIIVPGSSIKGALRTAMAYKILKELKQREPDFFDNLVIKEVNAKITQFEEECGNRFMDTKCNKLKETFSQNILEQILYSPKPPKPPKAPELANANYDLFRSVKITDGSIKKPIMRRGDVEVLNIGEHHNYLKLRRGGRPLRISCEHLSEKMNITFNCSLDLEIYNRIKNQIGANTEISRCLPTIGCVKDLLNIATEFTEDQWMYEKQFTNTRLKGSNFSRLPEFYNKSMPQNKKLFLRLGWGTGMLGMTIDLLFDGKQGDDLRQRIRNLSHDRGNEPAPKSRRLLAQDNEYLPFGWTIIDS